jgi:hypothetical protein
VPLLALLLLFAADDPAPAAAAAPPEAPATAPAEPDPKRLICFKEQQAGTLFTRKVCHTREEWKKLQERDRRGAGDMLDTGSSNASKRE